MARVTALMLRDRAREAMIAAGGRGFVRFPERGALLVSDAVRRCENGPAKALLLEALSQAGFDCREQDGLLMITPADALLAEICCEGSCAVDWDGPLCIVQALAKRWLSKPRQPLTGDGRQLIIDTLRLTWQDRVQEGLAALCAQATVMQRRGDISGFRIAGAVLRDWCDMQEGLSHED
ncbi:MAG: hypothetical protein IJ313_02040 [Clostridia bacterium]|nr:hypothetical protein [Clostridia bacterium]